MRKKVKKKRKSDWRSYRFRISANKKVSVHWCTPDLGPETIYYKATHQTADNDLAEKHCRRCKVHNARINQSAKFITRQLALTFSRCVNADDLSFNISIIHPDCPQVLRTICWFWLRLDIVNYSYANFLCFFFVLLI